MVLSGDISVRVCEGLFMSTFLLLPVLVYQAGLSIYLFTLLMMYIALKVVRKYTKTLIPPDGKAVFISGCDSGFGYALAIQLCNKGFRVFAGCLFPEGEGATNLSEKCPDNLFIVPLDVTKDASVDAAKLFVCEHLGTTQLWGLVSNAGVHCIGDIELTALTTYQRVFEINVFGMLRLTKTFLPLIRQTKGRVVVVSSIAALLKAPSFSCYAASKCALECLSDCLRMEMVKFGGVKVSIVEPGSFGGNTNITVGNNLQILYDEAEKTWENSDDDVKKVYGQNYTRSIIDRLLYSHDTLSSRNVNPVTDAIEDCLVCSNPAYRTVVHGGPYKVDALATLASLTSYLPEFITDWVLCKGTGHSDTSNLQGLKNAKLFKTKQH